MQNRLQTSLPNHVIALRWFARIVSIPLILIVVLIFLEDGLPFFLFTSDPIHMTALSLMLLGLLSGWKWDGLSAGLLLIGFLLDWLWVSLQFGEILLSMGPIFSFIPIIGLIFLYCWRRSKKTLSA